MVLLETTKHLKFLPQTCKVTNGRPVKTRSIVTTITAAVGHQNVYIRRFDQAVARVRIPGPIKGTIQPTMDMAMTVPTHTPRRLLFAIGAR